MRDPLTPQQFTRISVVAFLAFAAIVAVIHSRREQIGVLSPPEREQADANNSELARCRIITPDQTAALESCRRAWAAIRKHFFAPVKAMPAQTSSSGAPIGPAKSPDRITPTEAQSEAR